MKSCIFIGTSDFALQCLKYLLESDFFKVAALITIPSRQRGRGMAWQNSVVKTFGEKNLNIPCFTPEDLLEEEFLKKIQRLQSEFCVVCDYGKFLPKNFLNLFPKPSFNIHPSLLPLWRGAAPIERSLMNGDLKTGVSLQLVSEKLDAGDLLGQINFPIKEDETSEEIYQKSAEVSKTLLQENLVSYLKGEITAIPQKEAEASYAHKIKKEEAKINWNQEAHLIHNKVRALVLGPQAFTFYQGERLKIYKTQLVKNADSDSKNQAGEIIFLDKKQLIVSCGFLALKLYELQRSGRKKQVIQEFLGGVSIKKGDILGKELDI
ncbi:MAG: methionyl-tRNA formyltransferase [Bdellovibrionales bacterium]